MNRKLILPVVIISVVVFSCTKESIKNPSASAGPFRDAAVTEAITGYTTYTIKNGQHYSDKSSLKYVSTAEMKFYAKFDQTAIYTAVIPENQYDINKLYGFSEGFNNQYNSARMGWGYSNGAIRLYGYVYSKGVRYSQEITTVSPGQDITCSIKVSGSTYIITANGISVTLPRGTTTSKASGWQQYPYFGGNEVAPHNVYIYIKPF